MTPSSGINPVSVWAEGMQQPKHHLSVGVPATSHIQLLTFVPSCQSCSNLTSPTCSKKKRKKERKKRMWFTMLDEYASQNHSLNNDNNRKTIHTSKIQNSSQNIPQIKTSRHFAQQSYQLPKTTTVISQECHETFETCLYDRCMLKMNSLYVWCGLTLSEGKNIHGCFGRHRWKAGWRARGQRGGRLLIKSNWLNMRAG